MLRPSFFTILYQDNKLSQDEISSSISITPSNQRAELWLTASLLLFHIGVHSLGRINIFRTNLFNSVAVNLYPSSFFSQRIHDIKIIRLIYEQRREALMDRTRKRGFTLIELISVIVTLAILAAIAAPRFIDLADEANEATIRMHAINLQKAITDANLRWLILGSPGRIQNMTGFADNTIDMSTLGWPIGLNKGNSNDNVGRGNAGCSSLWNYLLVGAPRSATTNLQSFQSYRHNNNKSCSYIYRGDGDTESRVNAKLGVIYHSQTGKVQICGAAIGTPC